MQRSIGTPSPTYAFGEMFVGGEWRPGSSGNRTTVRNPWDGSAVAELVEADMTDVNAAYAAAAAAQPAWAATLPGDRAAVFDRAAAVMEARREEIVNWLVHEGGSTIAKAQIEWWAVHNSILEAMTLPSRVEGRILYGDYPGKENRIYRKPVGIVAVISPWNWPLHLSMRSVAPALALGNAVVIKPAGETPITGGLLIGKIFEEAGLPKGVLGVVSGPSDVIGDGFVQHPASRVVSFTGSTEVGRHIGVGAVTAPNIKRAMLELGGNGPLVVTEDVDLDHAAHIATVGKFFHQGQMCIAVNRIIVADAIHDAFVARFLARVQALRTTDPTDPATAFGPVISQKQLSRVQGMIERAKAQGARMLLGGDAQGLHLPAHVFDQVTPDMDIARQEIFGPVAPILRARDDDHAVALANDTEFGLTSGVLCRDEGRALRIAQRIEAGMTHINDIPAVDMPQLPFGGEKNSGLGRFGSKGMIEEFTTEHWISIQSGQSRYPF